MRIVNPSYGVSTTTDEVLTDEPLNWLKDPIALFSNSKPNARELMDGLKAKLAAVRPVDNIEFVSKPSASQPASAAIIDEVAHKFRAALLALGD